jgi:hypothetical protein
MCLSGCFDSWYVNANVLDMIDFDINNTSGVGDKI